MYEQNTEDNIVLSYRDWEEEYSELMSSILSGEPNIVSTNNENTVVSGKIEWELSSYSKLPLRNAYIEIIVKTDFEPIVLSSAYTDENGYYCLDINNSGWDSYHDIYFRINLEAHTFKVRSGWWTFPYYFDKKLPEDFGNGVNIAFNPTITRDISKKIYRATYVHQTMVIGERFAAEMGFETSNKIRVAYPAGKEDISDSSDPLAYLSNGAFCWGNVYNNCFCAIGWHKFEYANTIVHEYSHYVQCSLSNFGGQFPEIIYSSTHSSRDDDYLSKKDKEFAMHLAWAEGWGHAFAYMALKYYKDQYIGMLNYNVQPHLIDETNADNHDNFLGEFQEMTVTAFLWDLLDTSKLTCIASITSENLDYQIPWTPQEWWNMTTVSGTCRFPDFMRLLEEEAYNDSMNIDYKSVKLAMAKKLTKYNIAPALNGVSIVTSNPHPAPSINIIANGSESYPNNRFVIKIFDKNNNLLAKSNLLTVEADRFMPFDIVIPLSVWTEALSHYSCSGSPMITLKISVDGCRYDDREVTGLCIEEEFQYTGPYYSEYEQITVNLSHNYSYETYDSSKHRCICNNCGESYLTSHVADPSYIDSTGRFAKCRYCNALYRTTTITPIIKNKITIDEETE